MPILELKKMSNTIKELIEMQKYLIELIDNKFNTNNEILDKIHSVLSSNTQLVDSNPVVRSTIDPKKVSPIMYFDVKQEDKQSNEENPKYFYCISEDNLKKVIKDEKILSELEIYKFKN